MADRFVHPIEVAWLSTGGTGAQNYDEFADDAEIEAVLAAQPASALAVEMPHCTPAARSAGLGFAAALDDAVARLAALKDQGRLVRHDDALVAYRITGEQATAYGLFAMVDTAEISGGAGAPGRVVRNEEVFPAKVAERTALLTRLGHLLSPVLLISSTAGPRLERLLAEAIDDLGEPAVRDTDQLGQEHALWPLPPGERREEILDVASAGELVVADGNHRSLAAQRAGIPRFLAVVTTPDSVHIRAYNRLVANLPVPVTELLDRLRAAGCAVLPWEGPLAVPALPGTVALYAGGRSYAVDLPPRGGDVVDRLDHTAVDRLIFGRALGLDPDDQRIVPVGGDYPADWLAGQVDAGRAELAVLISPVTVADFLEVNLRRQQMPRKSTWFTPKARTGLVVAEVAATDRRDGFEADPRGEGDQHRD